MWFELETYEEKKVGAAYVYNTLVVKMTEKDYVYGAIRLMSMTTPT